jgi:hypothetical protein
MALNSGELNPAHIVTVTDFSPETLRRIIAHLEVSSDFEHLVYRESELDAIWSITGFVLQNEPNSAHRETVRRLHECALAAHDLIAAGHPLEAARALRSCL